MVPHALRLALPCSCSLLLAVAGLGRFAILEYPGELVNAPFLGRTFVNSHLIPFSYDSQNIITSTTVVTL